MVRPFVMRLTGTRGPTTATLSGRTTTCPLRARQSRGRAPSCRARGAFSALRTQSARAGFRPLIYEARMLPGRSSVARCGGRIGLDLSLPPQRRPSPRYIGVVWVSDGAPHILASHASPFFHLVHAHPFPSPLFERSGTTFFPDRAHPQLPPAASTPDLGAMRRWERSLASEPLLTSLVTRGLLAPLTGDVEWRASGQERSPYPLEGYVVSFVAFHQRGFGMPAHRFLRELLHHLGVSLQELSPNGVQQMDLFVALYDGFLGIDPHFDLFLYFFKATLVKPPSGMAPWGFCSIQMKRSRTGGYPRVELSTSIKDWHQYWFYLRNHDDGRLLAFSPTRAIPTVRPRHWAWGPIANVQRGFGCIACLRRYGLMGLGVIDAYYRRRVTPLMARPSICTRCNRGTPASNR